MAEQFFGKTNNEDTIVVHRVAVEKTVTEEWFYWWSTTESGVVWSTDEIAAPHAHSNWTKLGQCGVYRGTEYCERTIARVPIAAAIRGFWELNKPARHG